MLLIKEMKVIWHHTTKDSCVVYDTAIKKCKNNVKKCK